MVFVYTGLLLVFVGGYIRYRNYQSKFFVDLSSKEHPLKSIYPLAAWLADRLGKGKRKRGGHITKLLKSLYVRENVDQEEYIYHVKKTATIIFITFAIMLLGFIVSLSNCKTAKVENLERTGFGDGIRSYELEAGYRNEKKNVEISIDEVKLTRSEIIELFENSYEEVKRLMLGNNTSQDDVTEAVNLITEYKGINIYWEIDDLTAINYNGDIKKQLNTDETFLVNLTATFTIDDTREIFTYPLRLTGKELSSSEMLLGQIKKEIEDNNDIYEKQVILPKEIDGYRIQFFKVKSSNGTVFIFLAIAAVLAMLFLYDKKLEDRVKKRKEEMIADYPEIISRLNLLYGAGMSIYRAFERIVEEKELNSTKTNYAYMEIKLLLEKIKNGMNEAEAYAEFGKRCGLHAYIKLGNILEQNLNKGTKGVNALLSQEALASFEERKRNARKKGEQAGTKMLVPMVMMLIVAIAIITIPALMSIQF